MNLIRRAALCLAFTALLSQGAALAQSPNPHAVSLYNLGLQAYKEGSVESSIIFFRRACDIDPDLTDAQYNLGVLYQSQRRLKEAIPRFQEVLRMKPNDPDAHYQMGVALMDSAQGPQAKVHLQAVPPSSTHFQDAQRRIAMIDQAGASAAPYAGALATPATPLVGSTEPPPSTVPQTSTQVQGQVVGTPPVTQPIQEAVQPPQPVQPPQVAVAPPQATPPAVEPQQAAITTVMPNASVKVVANGFSAPAGLAFDRNGNLYVANFLSNTIDRISSDGTRTQFSQGVNISGPIGLAVDDQGNVYVANYKAGTVARINPAGVSSIVATNFKKPYYLTLDRDNNLFVSQQEDNSVVRIALPRPIGAKPPQ